MADLSFEKPNEQDDSGQSEKDPEDEGTKTKRLRTGSDVSVVSSTFGQKNTEEENEPKTIQRATHGGGIEWVLEAEFPNLLVFMDSPQYKDLMDNFNTDSKKINKKEDIIRSWVCKFNKKKKGFKCQVKLHRA